MNTNRLAAKGENSGKKSGKRPGTFTGPNDPRNGRGPKKGAPNAGRPRNEHVEWCQAQIADPKCEKAVRTVLQNPKHPAFATMWRALTDRAYGKPTQPVSNPDGSPLPPANINVMLTAARARHG